MDIRKAKLKDLKQVTKLGVSLLKQHYDFDPYYAPAKNVNEVYRKFFKGCIYSNKRLLLVAEENKKIIGYAVGELNLRAPVFKIRKMGHISDVFVKKDFRKLGIAKKFLIEIKKWFKSKNLKYIELSVHEKNTIAKKAWAKIGFEGYVTKQIIEMNKFNITS